MLIPRARSLSLVAALVATSFLAACSSDDDNGDPTGPPSLTGTWVATSFVALGMDFIAGGMGVTLTFANNGTYTLQVTNDLVELCGDQQVTDCTQTGTYTSTASTLTLDEGSPDELQINYTLQGSTLTFNFSIDNNPIVVTLARSGG